MSRAKVWLVVSFILALGLAGGCEFTPGGDPGLAVPYVFDLLARPAGYKLNLWGGDRIAEDPFPYKGITVHNVNRIMKLKRLEAKTDGTGLSFRACLDYNQKIERMWMLAQAVGEADLVTPPNLVNAKGQSVYVMGPLEPDGCQDVDLALDPWGGNGFRVLINFVSVDARVAFQSGHNPKKSLLIDLYSVDSEGENLHQYTHTTDYTNGFAAWSPAGEWLSYGKLESTACGASSEVRMQLYIQHPDGSNLRRLSTGLYNAASPTFSPDGRQVAFSCILDCSTMVNNICVYNLFTDELRVLFRGDGYNGGNIYSPGWSPDGNIMAFSADGPDPATIAYSIYYAPMDPITGDSLGSPVALMAQNVFRLLPDGKYHFINPRGDWNWAPDSRHGALNCVYKTWTGTAWGDTIEGIAIVDYQAMLDTGLLPAVPELTQITDIYAPLRDPASFYPNFGPEGKQLFFDRPVDSDTANLMVMDLTNYAPTTGLEQVFYSDGFENRVPIAFPSIKASFYPSWP